MIAARIALPTSLSGLPAALAAAGVADGDVGDGLVFGPEEDAPSTWAGVRASLVAAFDLTRQAVAAGAPVVYLILQPALLGHRGPVPGMLAGALASGVRELAMEGRRRAVRANALTYDDTTDPAVLARWVRALLELDGPSGDVIHLGRGHDGKVRP